MNSFETIFKSTFKFLSSLKLAVIVLLGLAYILALGTIYESLYGTAVAKERVYGTIWFTLVLFFLGVNVLCAALSRLPWKKHHIGFVVTHAGIIIILVGSVITQQWGIDGSMALAEGEVGDRVTLDEPLIQVRDPDAKSTQTWKARLSQNPPNSEKPWVKTLNGGGRFVVDDFYLHAQSFIKVDANGAKENPALEVVLSGFPKGPMMSEEESPEQSQWLFLKSSENTSSSAQLGPAKLYFVSEEDLRKLSNAVSHSKKIGSVQLQLEDGKSFEVEVEKVSGQTLPISGSDLKIQLLRYLPDARVIDNQLISRSEEPNNPALEFKLIGPDFEQTHLIFSQFPDLEAVHGSAGQKKKIKAQFISEASPKPMANAELYLAYNASSKEILYRLRNKGILGEVQKTSLGEKVATGWMTIQFQITRFFEKAQAVTAYRQIKLPPGKSGPPPAIHFYIEKDQKSEPIWMQQGDLREVVLGGVPYVIQYGLKAQPLGFTVQLKDFKIERYPGSNNPSSFSSDVLVKHEKKKQEFETKIFMNNPLRYEGFTFFQSSYQEGNGKGPDISIFTVGRDPGTPIKYFGSILLVGGIALMFWFKPLFVQKRMAQKREKVECVSEA